MRRFIFGLVGILIAAFSILFSLNILDAQQTDTSATRTAIAITREPMLGTPATPSSIELTSTIEYQNYTDRVATSWHHPDSELNATGTAIVALATQMAVELTDPPLLSPTPFPTETNVPCKLYFYKNIDNDLSRQVSNELTGTNLQGSLSVYKLELETPYNCSSEKHLLRTDIEISLRVHNPEDDHSIITAIEELLSYLEHSKLLGDAHTLRLIVEFSHIDAIDYCKFRQIDTGYTNARLAYKEGLRGEKLIEALGGILDTNQDLLGLCPFTN